MSAEQDIQVKYFILNLTGNQEKPANNTIIGNRKKGRKGE